MGSSLKDEASLVRLLRKPVSRRMALSVLGTGTFAAVVAACGGAPASPTTPAKAEATKPAAGATTAPAAGATKPAAEATKPAAAATKPAAGATTAPAAGATKPAAEAQQGGTLVIGMWQEPENLNPYITQMSYSIWISQAINQVMIETGKDDKLNPVLVKEVPTLENGGISQDGKAYTLKFRENLKWSDGQPLTGEDFITTWKLIMDPKTGATGTTGWDKISDVELSADKLTATVRLAEVHVPFITDVLTYAASSGAGFLLPKHYFDNVPPEKVKDDPFGAPGGNKYIGAGPFKIVEWTKGVSLTIERNPNWSGTPAKLDKIIYSFVGTREKEIDGLRTGDLDYAVDFIESQVPDLEQIPESIVHLSKAVASIERYHFNMWEPKSNRATPHRIWGGEDGAEIRKAMAMAMNRQAVVDKVLFGKATVAVNEMDNLDWFNSKLKPYPYDVAKAEETLDRLGWKKGADGIREKNGVKFEFVHSTTSGNVTRETIQRAFIADLEKVGIRMKIENYKPSEMFASFANGGIGATGAVDMWGWTTGSIDPNIFYSLFNSEKIPTQEKPDGENYMGYKNAEVDDLTKKQATAIDPKERKALVDKIQELLYNECPILYIYDRSNIDVGKNAVVGVEPYPAARHYWNMEMWGMTKAR